MNDGHALLAGCLSAGASESKVGIGWRASKAVASFCLDAGFMEEWAIGLGKFRGSMTEVREGRSIQACLPSMHTEFFTLAKPDHVTSPPNLVGNPDNVPAKFSGWTLHGARQI